MSTRVAVITDLHANLLATEAVLARSSGVLFVNCGSVGKPKDGDPRAAFGILSAPHGELDVSIERVAYDTLAVSRRMREVGLPDELAEKLVAAA
jgi:diadenosine tetraphosphatase ApaH/serine/threonine PP2A family protein phosphatase